VKKSKGEDEANVPDVYRRLEGGELNDASERKQAVEVFVSDAVSVSISDDSKSAKLTQKVIALENPTRQKSADTKRAEKQRRNVKNQKMKALSARQKRAMGIFKIPKEGLSYAVVQPMHDMWLNYMGDLLQEEIKRKKSFVEKFVRADLHGCILHICKSKCPSYVGIGGIVVQETQRMFVVVTEENKVRNLPKKGSVFRSVLFGKQVTIFGNQFVVRPAERSCKKFKARPTIEL